VWKVHLFSDKSFHFLDFFGVMEAFLYCWSQSLPQLSALLACWMILESRWLQYRNLKNRPLGIISWSLYLFKKLTWLSILANWIFRHSCFLSVDLKLSRDLDFPLCFIT
jgi:hypothetical protein